MIHFWRAFSFILVTFLIMPILAITNFPQKIASQIKEISAKEAGDASQNCVYRCECNKS